VSFRNVTVLAAATGLLLLGACVGDEEAPTLDPKSVRDLTGLSAPTETPAAQTARAPAIISRSDSLLISTMHGETDHLGIPTFRLRARCSGTRCVMSEPTTGFTQTIRLADLDFVAADAVAVGTKHGITLVSGTRERTDGYVTSFGAWMEHGSFTVQTERLREQEVTVYGRYGLAGGDLSISRPTGDATWLGLMVGTTATGTSRGDRLQGDAALNYDLSSNSIDVAFSSITNVDRGRAHSTRTVMFQDVQVGRRGTFEAGLAGNRIQGGFYGPGHVESAGIFEQANIVGAFGARRQ